MNTLIITNPKTGLSKEIDTKILTIGQIVKITEFYESVNYETYIK